MADDCRVSLDPIFAAFGVPVTVTRPAPDDTPIETVGVWIPSDTPDVPTGSDARRREERKVLGLQREKVPTLPRGTQVLAPELKGGTVLRWRVDTVERVDADEYRAALVRDEQES